MPSKYDKQVRFLLTNKPDISVSKTLPSLLEDYLRGSVKELSPLLLNCLANWLSNLEKRLYGNNKLSRQQDYERRLDRILLFIEYAKENKDKDGAYLLYVYRKLFAYAELVLQCRARKIALPSMSVTKMLQSAELKFLKALYSILQELRDKGVPSTEDNIVESWVAYKTKKNRRAPGHVATKNFRDKVRCFQEVAFAKLTTERSWVSRSDSLVSG